MAIQPLVKRSVGNDAQFSPVQGARCSEQLGAPTKLDAVVGAPPDTPTNPVHIQLLAEMETFVQENRCRLGGAAPQQLHGDRVQVDPMSETMRERSPELVEAQLVCRARVEGEVDMLGKLDRQTFPLVGNQLVFPQSSNPLNRPSMLEAEVELADSPVGEPGLEFGQPLEQLLLGVLGCAL